MDCSGRRSAEPLFRDLWWGFVWFLMTSRVGMHVTFLSGFGQSYVIWLEWVNQVRSEYLYLSCMRLWLSSAELNHSPRCFDVIWWKVCLSVWSWLESMTQTDVMGHQIRTFKSTLLSFFFSHQALREIKQSAGCHEQWSYDRISHPTIMTEQLLFISRAVTSSLIMHSTHALTNLTVCFNNLVSQLRFLSNM